MRTTAVDGDGGHDDGDDEGRADEGNFAEEEKLPVEGAAGMAVSVAGVADRANRLHSSRVSDQSTHTRGSGRRVEKA